MSTTKDPPRSRPRPLGDEGLGRVSGGVGPLSPEDLTLQRQRIVIDLRDPPKQRPRKK